MVKSVLTLKSFWATFPLVVNSIILILSRILMNAYDNTFSINLSVTYSHYFWLFGYQLIITKKKKKNLTSNVFGLFYTAPKKVNV